MRPNTKERVLFAAGIGMIAFYPAISIGYSHYFQMQQAKEAAQFNVPAQMISAEGKQEYLARQGVKEKDYIFTLVDGCPANQKIMFDKREMPCGLEAIINYRKSTKQEEDFSSHGIRYTYSVNCHSGIAVSRK